MKFNWGTLIAIGYSSFIFFIGCMVYFTFGEKYDLVTEDYYAQEIAFQGKIDSKERAKSLHTSVKTSIKGEELSIHFPNQENAISGTIQCFRPSDEARDFTERFSTTTGIVSIPLNQFIKGKYILKMDWSVSTQGEESHFYQEQSIVIP